VEQQTDQGTSAPAAPAPVAAPVVGSHTVAGLEVTSAGRRIGAYLLEGVLISVTFVIGWFIWSLVLWGQGQSPAKKLLGMRVVDLQTEKAATFGTMFMREIVGKGLIGGITFGITAIVSIFTILGASRQGVHDKIAKTIVVDDPNGRLAA
jgi:uncharacterized RDD family membrane protein YckC